MIIIPKEQPARENVAWSYHQGIHGVREMLKRLESPDLAERLETFKLLRSAPRELVTQAWVEARQITPAPGFGIDCLQRAEVETKAMPHVSRAIASVVTPGYEQFVPEWLASIRRFGECPEAKVFLFCVDDSFETLKHLPVLDLEGESLKQNISLIPCRSLAPVNAAIKGILYSCSRFISADLILTLELDMLVVSNLQPLWEALSGIDDRCIAGCRPQLCEYRDTFAQTQIHMDFPESDFEWITGSSGSAEGKFLFNGGLLAGGKRAWGRLDANLRALNPFATLWIEGGCEVTYRDEFMMNLALCLSGDFSELSPAYNVQMYSTEREKWFKTTFEGNRPTYFDGSGVRKAAILHFMLNKALMPVVWKELTGGKF